MLSRSTVDRDEAVRTDARRLAERWPGAKLVLVDPRGRTPVRTLGGVEGRAPLSGWGDPGASSGGGGDYALSFQDTAGFGPTPPERAVLLGESGDDVYWALRVDERADRDDPSWADLRAVGALLGDTDAGLLTAAVALLNWHDAAGFCSACGSPTRRVKAGWARDCPACGREEYPRTDPAVICLVHDEEGVNGEHVLLARQAVWPAERYSVLAGFVEAGESLEACVAREIAEEVGVAVRGVRYLGSQPWPLPRSLMVGFAAVASRETPLQPRDGEIEEAHWVHRDEVRAALAAGGSVPGLILPGRASIARQMLEGWANASG
ncbi:NAD(+) diphosphatase [Streptoalloteichus tenebrarius]|nr:NAD(+) diphosphatase [Streptoalloteichus tenebrarius]